MRIVTGNKTRDELHDEFVRNHNLRIITQYRKGILSRILRGISDKVTNTKRDIFGHRIYPDNVIYRLAIDHLKTMKNEVEFRELAVQLDIHWLRLKSVLYTQKLVSTPNGIRMRRESLVPGWTPVLRESKIYFRRTEQST